MHGTYAHRITCNLYPDQYHCLKTAAHEFDKRTGPFVRDAALAYVNGRHVIPGEIEHRIEVIQREVRRIGISLSQIANRANTLHRLTHDDLQTAGALVLELAPYVRALCDVLQTLSV